MSKFEDRLPASDGRYKPAARFLRKAWNALPDDPNLDENEKLALFLGMIPTMLQHPNLNALLTATATLATRSNPSGRPTVVSTLLDDTGACAVHHDPNIRRADAEKARYH